MSLEERIDQLTPRARPVWQALCSEVEKLGLGEKVAVKAITEAEFYLDRDPASGEDSLIGEWRDEQGIKHGMMTFHADGSFFAEYDVVRVHPSREQWFVEAVTAWGRDDEIKSEPRLLPYSS